MSESYIQLVSTAANMPTYATLVTLTVLATTTILASLVLLAAKGLTRAVAACLCISLVTLIVSAIICVMIDPNATASRYIGEEPTGTVAVIETRETARGTEATNFEITLDAYPNDPTVIVDDCNFDKMPEAGDHIEFAYKNVRMSFDDEHVHVVLTNWWEVK